MLLAQFYNTLTTLLVLRAEGDDVVALKAALLSFASATGPQINFHKSTVAPMNVDDPTAMALTSILGCKQETFP